MQREDSIVDHAARELTMNISVIQPGARLHYAVPAILARAGLLRRLYTDIHAEHALIRAADRLLPQRMKPKVVRRLFGRRLPEGLPQALVHDRPLETLVEALLQTVGRRGNSYRVSQRLLVDLERAPLDKGDAVYTVLINEDLDVMRALKKRGVKIVHECIIGPDVGLFVAEEIKDFPNVHINQNISDYEEGRRKDAEKYALCDLILVPSSFTERAVRDLAGNEAPVSIVPYGFDLEPFTSECIPERGRVLCVGSVGVRKGHPYLASAARKLREAGSEAKIRVVGPTHGINLDDPALEGPVYVGQVPRQEVVEEFRRADVFAFPTVCDSFGIVLVEALAAGVPVVCTTNCGDIVRDGIDGFIVPPRDPTALAQRVRQIVDDRDLRNWMSLNARERAREFSADRYADRLLNALGGL